MTTAVILVAGKGSRLGAITAEKPKCMVRVAGEPILRRQLAALASAGVRRVVVVAGYRSEMVLAEVQRSSTGVEMIVNREHETTNNMYSLGVGLDQLAPGEDAVILNGDVALGPDIVSGLLASPARDAIAVDAGRYLDESMKVTVDAAGAIRHIAKDIPRPDAFAVSIDLYRLSPDAVDVLRKRIREITGQGRRTEWSEVALDELMRDGSWRPRPYDIGGRRWVEIDTIEDLLEADRAFSDLDPFESTPPKRLALLDMDGTLFVGDNVVPGAPAFVDRLRSHGVAVRFISNNSSRSHEGYVTKLRGLGIAARPDEIVLSSDVAIDHLRSEGITDAYIVGTRDLIALCEVKGLRNVEHGPTDVVLLGYDTELTYRKLARAGILIGHGARLFATHLDRVCPTPEGPVPDAGSMIALFEHAYGRAPERVFGKPDPEMVSYAMRGSRVGANETFMVGDRLYTDAAMAHAAGIDFVCVLTGDTDRAELEKAASWPRLVVPSVAALGGGSA